MLIGEVWAARSSPGLTSVGPDSAGSPSPLKSLSAANFTLPQELGTIQESVEVPDSDKTVIHIQDAHCNYAAQKSIAEILNYLTTEYGIKAVNCEGGAEGYDLSMFTDIPEKDIREKTSDYFVREGIVSAAEYYAVNNPAKVNLWGVEDPDLYLRDLKIYRDSLAHKAEVDKYIKSIGYILDNLKRHIYSTELLEFDGYYTGYKENKKAFKEYTLYLISMAQKMMIDIKSFSNIYLLSQTLEEEDKINFKRANNEKDEVVDKLKKSLSRNELEDLMVMVGKVKTERISQADFYAYLAKKAKSVKLDLKDYPELQKYIVYISIYGAIDKTKVSKEMDALEDRIRESLYENDTQRELGILSKNLTLTKNIFNISLTRDDFTYYMEHRATFAVENYVRFIDARAPLYKMRAVLDKGIDRLDQYRDNMDRFYQISLERDKAFIKNIKFTDHDRPSSIIITGGFHTENLRELFKNEKVSYVSIMPKFRNPPGYESPYLKRLSGQRTALENVIDTAIPAVLNLQAVEILTKLGVMVEGRANIEGYRLLASIIAALYRGQDFILKINKGVPVKDTNPDEERFVTFTRGEGSEAISSKSEPASGMESSVLKQYDELYDVLLTSRGSNELTFTPNPAKIPAAPPKEAAAPPVLTSPLLGKTPGGEPIFGPIATRNPVTGEFELIPRQAPPAAQAEDQEALAPSLLKYRDTIRGLEESKVLAVVVVNDEERLKNLEGVGSVNMTGINPLAERLISNKRNSQIVYVKTIEEAEKAADRIQGKDRPWTNTFFFVEGRIMDRERSAYDDLKNRAFIWNLNIPDNSLCNVTPLGFILFSMKFNDFLTRIQQGDEDLNMEPLAEILLHNRGEAITRENTQQVVEDILKPIADNFVQNKDPIALLKDFSGKFTWDLPKIEPQNWTEVDKYFKAMEKVYTAL